MTLLIIIERNENWSSLKMVRTYKFKFIGKLCKIFYKWKGYEVEVLE